jgi:hypothetical protein
MENSINIYYLLLSELDTKNILYELIIEKTNANVKSKEIFQRMAHLKTTNSNIVNQRNKIPSGDSWKNTFYYFYITENSVFIFLEASDKYPESQAFKFIDNIVQENIHLMTNDNGELNNNGKNKLKALLAKYQDNGNLAALQTDLDDIQLSVKDTLNRQLQNINNLKALDNRTIKIKDNADAFKKESKDLKKITYKNNLKMILIITAIVVILLVVIILPIVLSQLPSSQLPANTTILNITNATNALNNATANNNTANGTATGAH